LGLRKYQADGFLLTRVYEEESITVQCHYFLQSPASDSHYK